MAVFITLGDSDELQIRIPIDGQTGWGPQLINDFFRRLVEHDHSGVDGRGTPISGSGLAADSVSGTRIRLLNDEFLRARNAADSGDVDIIKVNTSNEIEFGPTLGAINAPTINSAIANLDVIDYMVTTASATPITAPNNAVTNSAVVICTASEVATVRYKVTRGSIIQGGVLECNGSTQDISDEFVGPDSGVTFSLSATNELIVTTTDNVDAATITYTIDRR